MTTARISAIVLAAGLSSRMGTNKMLIEIDGQPLLRLVVGRALRGGFDSVRVVLGHQRERAAEVLDGLDCELVDNLDYRQGMTTSLRAGIGSLDDDTAAAVMLLGDMPHVSSQMMAAIGREHLSSGATMVVSEYGEQAIYAPPTLFSRLHFPEILSLPDDRCPRFLIKKHQDSAAVMKWPVECLHDLDRPTDLDQYS